MKKTLICLLSALTLFFAGITFANNTEHYSVRFASGNIYDATLRGNHLSWTGIAGVDKGEVRENKVKHISLSKGIDVYQWTEKKTGSFVVLVLDKKNHKAVCSGERTDKKQWFWQGSLQQIS